MPHYRNVAVKEREAGRSWEGNAGSRKSAFQKKKRRFQGMAECHRDWVTSP